jgi:uncharacterized membrane protein YjjP (DUF1212 family)
MRFLKLGLAIALGLTLRGRAAGAGANVSGQYGPLTVIITALVAPILAGLQFGCGARELASRTLLAFGFGLKGS